MFFVSKENYWFAVGALGNVANCDRRLVYLLQHKVMQMLQNVSSEERVVQTKYIGE